jgi:hypothetical protein
LWFENTATALISDNGVHRSHLQNSPDETSSGCLHVAMTKTAAILLGWLVLSPLLAQEADILIAKSVLYGTVTDSDGNVAKGVSVRANPLACRIQLSSSSQGRFPPHPPYEPNDWGCDSIACYRSDEAGGARQTALFEKLRFRASGSDTAGQGSVAARQFARV